MIAMVCQRRFQVAIAVGAALAVTLAAGGASGLGFVSHGVQRGGARPAFLVGRSRLPRPSVGVAPTTRPAAAPPTVQACPELITWSPSLGRATRRPLCDAAQAAAWRG